jgi:hypothetical protein
MLSIVLAANLTHMSVQAASLAKGMPADITAKRSELLVDSRDVLLKMQPERKAEPTLIALVGPWANVHGEFMLAKARLFSKWETTLRTLEITPLKVNRAEMTILGTDMTKQGSTARLIASVRLLHFMNGPYVQAQVAAPREGRSAVLASV